MEIREYAKMETGEALLVVSEEGESPEGVTREDGEPITNDEL